MLSGELLSQLRRIEIETSRLANEQMAGQYRSGFRGHGMSFEEVRPYQQGDDIRSIDWNVSARTGDLFVKVFVEERELTVFLLLDMSGSAEFGSRKRTRKDLIAVVAGLLAFSAIRNNDRVGLIIFTDKVEHFVPPKKGRTHVLRVIRDILEFKPERSGEAGEGITDALKYLMKITKKTSVAFLVSDFFASNRHWSDIKKYLSIAHQRHDIVPLMTLDQMDERLPEANLIMFEDLETGEPLLLDTGRSARSQFSILASGSRAKAESLFKTLSMDYEVLWTDKDFVPSLIHLFRRRARRF